MTGSKCAVCGRPVNDARLCQHCTDRLEQVLAEFPALDRELELTETRQTAMGAKNGSRSSETPVVFNVDASMARDDIVNTLVGWVRDLEPSTSRQPVLTLTGMARWLLAQLPAIRQHLTVDALTDEIGYASRQGWRAVDRPANRSRVKVADCLDDSCAGELWAFIPTATYDPDDDATHARITCTACDVVYPAESWLRLGRRVLALRRAA